MSFPDFGKSTVLHYDESEKELGAVLCQQQNGNLKEISYVSQTFHHYTKKITNFTREISLRNAATICHTDQHLMWIQTKFSDLYPQYRTLNPNDLRWVAEIKNHQLKIR